MNLKEYEKENISLLTKLSPKYKEEYFKIYKYLKFEDSINLRKIITENTILKELSKYQEEGKKFNFEEKKEYLNEVYKSTLKIDSKYRKYCFLSNFFLLFSVLIPLIFIINLIEGNKLETNFIAIPPLLPYFLILYSLFYILFEKVLKFPSNNYLRNLSILLPTTFISQILKDSMPLAISMYKYLLMGIFIIGVLGSIIFFTLKRKEYRRLKSN